MNTVLNRKYIFTEQHRINLKRMLDNVYGKETNTSDYVDSDRGVPAMIKNKTDERIGASTLERIVGLVKNENRQPRIETLRILAKFFDFKDIPSFFYVLGKNVASKSIEIADFNDIVRNHLMKIEFESNKMVTCRYKVDNRFEVVEASNMKFEQGDIMILANDFGVGNPLRCIEVIRGKRKLGGYFSGPNNPIIAISLTR